MFATRWEPRGWWTEMHRLRNEMDRLFGDNGVRRVSASVYPPLNLWEDDQQLYVEAELPGFELSDLEITVTGENQLALKGERKRPDLGDGSWYLQERGYGAFHRVIALPEHVDAGQVTAEFQHGVLTVILPQKEEAKPRRIEVKSG